MILEDDSLFALREPSQTRPDSGLEIFQGSFTLDDQLTYLEDIPVLLTHFNISVDL